MIWLRTPCLLLALSAFGCHLAFPHPEVVDGGARDRAVSVQEAGDSDGSSDGPRTDRGLSDFLTGDLRAIDLRPDQDLCLGISCDDKNPCTLDSCSLGTCQHTPLDAPCDDGDPCTVESCKNGSCVATPKCKLAHEKCDAAGKCVCVSGYVRCGTVCQLGECCNGQQQACDRCGTATCINGVWNCSGQKTCNPGDNCSCEEFPTCTSGSCAGCNYHQQKVCNPNCEWGGCFG